MANSNPPAPNSSPQPVATQANKSSITKFTAAKLKEWRKLGLCYYYDEKYNPNHNCRAQCLALLGKEDLDEMLQLSDEDCP